MLGDTLNSHHRHAVVRLRRAAKALQDARLNLVDAFADGTDALSMEEARDAEALMEQAHEAIVTATGAVSGAQAVLDHAGKLGVM